MASRDNYDPFELASQQLSFKYNNPRPDREDRYKPKYLASGDGGGGGGAGASNNSYFQSHDQPERNQSVVTRRNPRMESSAALDLDSNHPPFQHSIYLTDTDADRPAWLQYAIRNSDGPLDDEDEDDLLTPQGRTRGRTMRDEDYEAITGIPALEDEYKPRGPLRSKTHQPKLIPNYPTLTAPETPDTEYSSVITPMYQSLSRDQGGRMRTRIEVYELQEQRRGMELAKQGKISHDTMDKFYNQRDDKPKDNILWPWSKYYSWNTRRRPLARAAMLNEAPIV